MDPADAIPDMTPGIGYKDAAIFNETASSAFAFDATRFL